MSDVMEITGARCNRSTLVSGSALAVVAMLLLAPQRAYADDECGAPVNGVVTCTSAGNPYTNGITYALPDSGLTIVTNTDTRISNSLQVNGANFSGGDLKVVNNGAITIASTAAANGFSLPGIGATDFSVNNADVESPGTISVTGVGAEGIDISMKGMAIIHAGDITAIAPNNGYAAGIAVSGLGNATVSFNTINTTGFGAIVFAPNVILTGTNVTAASGSNFAGVKVDAFDFYSNPISASVAISGTVTAAGPGSFGVQVLVEGSGPASVSVNNVSAGAFGVTAGGTDVTIKVAGSVVVSGTSPELNANFSKYNGEIIDGVMAFGYGDTGTSSVVNTGSITVAGNGAHAVIAAGNGGVTISGAGSASTSGTGSDAVRALSSRAISVTTGAISTTGDNSSAIVARSTVIEPVEPQFSIVTNPDNPPPVVSAPGNISGPVSVTATSVTTKGVNASGIIASSDTDAVTVNAGTVAVSGMGARGIVATGAGPVAVTSGAASARDATVITATSAAGATAVTLNGVTATGAGPAVAVTGATSAALTLGSGGTLTTAGGGATLTSATGSTLTNAGTITGNGTTAIVTATGGALSFTNSGRFAGLLGLTAGDDRVTNSGSYTALADQDFGAGANSFVNSGTLAVLTGASAAGTVRFARLQSLANTGLIDLRNGHAGDVLNLSGSFTGTGASTLGIDVSGGTADKLVVGGAITGSTVLLVNRVSGGAAGAAAGGTVFAIGGAGSSPTAFTIAGAQSTGFVQFGITFDAAAISYALLDGPTDAVFRSVRIGEGAQQLWYLSTDAWSAHTEGLRDGGRAGGSGRVWGQITGQANTRTGAQNFAVVGRSIDLSYRQDAFGGQLGVDLGRVGGPVTFGVTGGYLNSSLNFRNVAERTKYDSVNVGVYAGFTSGGLFVNALGKYDYVWLDTTSQPVGYTAKFHGNSYGAQGEAGYRFGSKGFYAEPVLSIAYVRTDLKDMHALDATFDFDTEDGLRGKAGARVGSTMDIGRGAVMTVFAQGSYVHEFRGTGGVTFTEGGTVIAFRDQPIGDYGQGKLGFSVATPGGVTGFIEGFGNLSDRYKGGGGRAGLRLAF